MKWPRRNFLGSSAVLFGAKLLQVLTTPSHRWSGTPELQGATIPNPENSPAVTFVDVADR